ncbi:uncharacterized protein DDB_G0287625-like [Zingiber officinale]|uniref:uncharacterized protein DDB_G0287625-like n=1 Tax=Zingiber officinale TaxID=94328 RepID=UPI001C4B978E|nr:uncharacterized protein DDB_G0287625-like [Zingiber officinale]
MRCVASLASNLVSMVIYQRPGAGSTGWEELAIIGKQKRGELLRELPKKQSGGPLDKTTVHQKMLKGEKGMLETDFHKRGEIKGNEPLFELSDSDNRLLPNESSKAQVDELLFDSSGRDPDYNDSSDPSRSNPNGNNSDHNDSYDLSRSNLDHNDSSDLSRRNPNRNNPDHDDSYDLSRSNPDHINSSNPQLWKSNRKGMPKHHYEIEGHTYIISSIDEEKPKNIDEALSCPLRDKWINVMEEEIDSMKSNNVWKLVEISHGHKAIRNKWVLNIKRKADGTIERYKARLVAKGYNQ